jgi:NADH:ubiquinone oxidoreductase subunit 3 (subunit A)
MNLFTVLILFIFVPILALILLILNFVVAPNKPDQAKASAYECGMPTFLGQTRLPQNIKFYIVAMSFLIFDLELLFMMPLAVSLYHVNIFGCVIAISFFVILTIGFILEYLSGAISFNTKSEKY